MDQPAYLLPDEGPVFVSAEGYWYLERETVNKHEYYFGKTQGIAGARPARNRFCFSFNNTVGAQLESKTCAGYTSTCMGQATFGMTDNRMTDSGRMNPSATRHF